MTRFMKSAFAATMLAGIAMPASAQLTNQASATGTTTIIRPVTIENDSNLIFGRIVKPSTGSGTITISDSADTVTPTGGALVLGTGQSRAKFDIQGEGAQSVSITVPANFTMTHTNTTDTLLVTLDPDLTASETLSGSLGGAGSLALNVGGAFPISSTTVTGAYSGSFNVTVSYN